MPGFRSRPSRQAARDVATGPGSRLAALDGFINPKKLERMQPAYCARAIAELYAAHLALRLAFCSNRKTANEWARNFFAAVWTRHRDTTPPAKHDPVDGEFPF